MFKHRKKTAFIFSGRLIFIVLIGLLFVCAADAQTCIECHSNVTPGAVSDWQLSKHSQRGVGCAICHGDLHKSDDDAALSRMPTPDSCGRCHSERVAQHKSGKHALAWSAMKALPTVHMQPMALIDGQKGCGSCHKIGIKTEAEIEELRKQGNGYGVAACNSCHTRHTFSVVEARQPQACQTCHAGFDHPQWEMYSGSKHGVRYLQKQLNLLPSTAVAPTCQTCHMQNGDHGVKTAWGFLAGRLPMPEDKQWAADRATILQALNVLDPDGNPTARLDLVKTADIARLTHEDWQKERDKMVAVCSQCHAGNFAKGELAKSDDMIREADRLMAEAIRVVAGLYEDGTLQKPKDYAYSFPDLLTFHDAPTVIEQKLFVMFMEHRMRTFQGAFHANPDYAFWYGWSEMRRSLTAIQSLAEDMRRAKK